MTEARAFEILTAIDLRAGRVVRLRQGDFEQETAYGDDPVAVARGFARAGARWLHVVDLDAARSGSPVNDGIVGAILEAVGDLVRVEVAGGFRSPASVAAALASGAARVVIGTAAIRDPAFAEDLALAHGADRIAVAIDVRDGHAVGHGWAAGSGGVEAAEAIERLADAGIVTFEVTAIDRDGLLGGPDLRLCRRLVALGRGSIVASGGIASVRDIGDVRAAGCSGAIVGRAIYEGRLSVGEALAAAGS